MIWLLLALTIVGCQSPDADEQTVFYFLRFDENGVDQLFSHDLVSAETTQLTTATHPINQFSPSPDGRWLIFDGVAPDGSSSLYRVETNAAQPQVGDLVLSCELERCWHPLWANDSRRVIFEKATLDGLLPRLFWLDTETGESVPLFDGEVYGFRAAFSADNAYLSFVRPNIVDGITQDQADVVVFHFESGRQFTIPNSMNSQAAWHPTEGKFLIIDLEIVFESFGSHILLVDVESESLVDLTEDSLIDDANPSWSPDGKTIAFGRKPPQVAQGRQLNLMTATGEQKIPLTSNIDHNHGPAYWSADGQRLLFQHFDLSQIVGMPSVHLYNLSSNTSEVAVENGFLPQWAPPNR